jgi:alkanesulfonate monooxygenase SsuD/methylene tetrahydromethanopterin reductase-like flavin-dependent oxidoreductase (luciferase family)
VGRGRRDGGEHIEERLPRLNPQPTRRIPILIGGEGERAALKIVAEHAHIWNGFGDPQEAGRKSGILDRWCEKVRRDPREIERSILINADQIPNADAYVENGINHLILRFSGPEYDLSPLRELISWRDEYRERHPEAAS